MRLHLRKVRRRKPASPTNAERRRLRRHPPIRIGIDWAKPGDDRTVIIPRADRIVLVEGHYDGHAIDKLVRAETDALMRQLCIPPEYFCPVGPHNLLAAVSDKARESFLPVTITGRWP